MRRLKYLVPNPAEHREANRKSRERTGALRRPLFLRNRHHLRMPPQPLQFVKRACFGRKDVYQIVAVIGENPFGVRETFHADRILAAPFELLADLLHDGLDLLGIAPATDHEKIREGSYLA